MPNTSERLLRRLSETWIHGDCSISAYNQCDFYLTYTATDDRIDPRVKQEIANTLDFCDDAATIAKAA